MATTHSDLEKTFGNIVQLYNGVELTGDELKHIKIIRKIDTDNCETCKQIANKLSAGGLRPSYKSDGYLWGFLTSLNVLFLRLLKGRKEKGYKTDRDQLYQLYGMYYGLDLQQASFNECMEQLLEMKLIKVDCFVDNYNKLPDSKKDKITITEKGIDVIQGLMR